MPTITFNNYVFENVLLRKPVFHVDAASTYELSGYISKITKCEFVEYRSIDTHINNLTIKCEDTLNLPYETDSLLSVSCLHVIEHIGLGRYGDPTDPSGFEKACNELERVIKKGGSFFAILIYTDWYPPPGGFVFNVHRVSYPVYIMNLYEKCKLLEFNVVNAAGGYIIDTEPEKYFAESHARGMYLFRKLK